MKIPHARGPAESRPAIAPEEIRKKGAFAKVLDGKVAEDTPAPPTPWPAARNTTTVKETDAAAPVQPVRVVEQLANEISVAVKGTTDIEIQFDSKTLSGLNVRITKDNGRLNVRLESASPEVCRQLTQHAGALVDRLEQRGYPKPVVQVKSTPSRDGRQDQRRDPRR